MTRFVKAHHLPTDTFYDNTIHTCDEAYICPDKSQSEMLWIIYDTDGTKIGHASSREVAMAVAFQNNLTPFSVH